MKLFKLIILSVCTLTTFAFSKDFSCKIAHQVKWDMPLELELSATISSDIDNTYTLTNRVSFFDLDHYDDEESWYKFNGNSSEVLKNIVSYKPRKYQGHMKFNYDNGLIGEDSESRHSGFYGMLELLIPTDVINKANSGDVFYAPVIMTWVSDHWGGSRTLRCTVK